MTSIEVRPGLVEKIVEHGALAGSGSARNSRVLDEPVHMEAKSRERPVRGEEEGLRLLQIGRETGRKGN